MAIDADDMQAILAELENSFGEPGLPEFMKQLDTADNGLPICDFWCPAASGNDQGEAVIVNPVDGIHPLRCQWVRCLRVE